MIVYSTRSKRSPSKTSRSRSTLRQNERYEILGLHIEEKKTKGLEEKKKMLTLSFSAFTLPVPLCSLSMLLPTHFVVFHLDWRVHLG